MAYFFRSFVRCSSRYECLSTMHIISIQQDKKILTQFGSLGAVEVIWQIAFLLARAVIVEHHAIGTQFFGHITIMAGIVFVALLSISEKAIRLWTI